MVGRVGRGGAQFRVSPPTGVGEEDLGSSAASAASMQGLGAVALDESSLRTVGPHLLEGISITPLLRPRGFSLAMRHCQPASPACMQLFREVVDKYG